MTELITEANKPCFRCGVAPREYRSYCRTCKREIEREYAARTRERRREVKRQWRQDNLDKAREQGRERWARRSPEEKRDISLRSKHGITLEEFNLMIEKQDGVCPVCLLPDPTFVDHNHKTGRVRGVLHPNCNTGIGLLGDSPENLLRAANYLGHEDE